MIEVRELTKRYGGTAAVNRVSFDVGSGRVAGFLGPNGAGKTTTMRMLACFVPPTSGEARVAGYDVVRESLEVRRRIGYMPENVPLYGEMRVREYSDLMNVDTKFVAKIINEQRGITSGGRKVYTLEDIYPHADLVTYPSNFEGFGNAFLEAIYFSKPIVVNNYSIYSTDIKPKGFDVIEIDGYVSDEAVEKTKRILA